MFPCKLWFLSMVLKHQCDVLSITWGFSQWSYAADSTLIYTDLCFLVIGRASAATWLIYVYTAMCCMSFMYMLSIRVCSHWSVFTPAFLPLSTMKSIGPLHSWHLVASAILGVCIYIKQSVFPQRVVLFKVKRLAEGHFNHMQLFSPLLSCQKVWVIFLRYPALPSRSVTLSTQIHPSLSRTTPAMLPLYNNNTSKAFQTETERHRLYMATQIWYNTAMLYHHKHIRWLPMQSCAL